MSRAGYAAKCALYGVLGYIAFDAAFSSQQSPGTTDAIREIGSGTLGTAMLWLLTLGLVCYGLFRLMQAALDLNHDGKDAKGIAKRTGQALSGLVHLGLAFFAGRLAAGAGGGSSSSKDSMTAQLMSETWGQWLLVAIGIGVIIAGLAQFGRAVKASFMKLIDATGKTRDAVRKAGRVGFVARGIVFCIIGGLVCAAVWQQDAEQASGGIGKALGVLKDQPFGPWLLAGVALGLICYSVYCGAVAIHRSKSMQTED